MRAVVQRVKWARVVVDGVVAGAVDGVPQALLILVGVTHGDDVAAAQRLAGKVWRLRVLDDLDGAMNVSCEETGAPILVVSQFTLYADTSRGRRPGWSAAASGAVAEPLVDAVVEALRGFGAVVETGRFGADMLVESANDGPVTVIVDV